MLLKRGLFCLFILLSAFTSAHVKYVLDNPTFENSRGPDVLFLTKALVEPFNLSLMIVSTIVIILLYFGINRMMMFKHETKIIEKQSRDYLLFIPLLARIGLAITVIGAGTAQVLLSPSIQTSSVIGTLQIALGFLLFTGLFSGLAVIAILVLYISALFTHPYSLGNLDILGLGLTILAFGSERPGVGDIIGMKFIGRIKSLYIHVPRILSACIGIAFMYLAIFEKILNPHLAGAVVDKYGLTSVIHVSAAMWVLSAGIIEFLVGLLLFIRFKPRLISAVAFMVISASFFYFTEAVYAHITLFITLFIIFIIGKHNTLPNLSTPKRK